MGFLNPFILAGLAAAAIPLLLHLLNLRKLKRVEFSSLRFLKELQKTKIRRLKLRQILLLILRTAIIVFAVLAFARPVLQGTSGLPGTRADAAAVIILDNSMSMMVRDEGGERLRQAKEGAIELLEEFRDGDRAAIVTMADPAEALQSGLVGNREDLIRQVEAVTPAYSSPGLQQALAVAASLLADRSELNREIYVLTDAQRASVEGLADAGELIPEGVRVFVVPVGADAEAPVNLGIDSVEVLSSVFESDREIDVRAWVTNYGNRTVDDALLSLYAEDSRLAQAGVSLQAGESRAVELSAPPRRSGIVAASVRIEGDALEIDNRRHFGFRIVDASRVALVGRSSEIGFLRTVLRLYPGLVLQTFDPGSLGAIDLASYSAVILVDPPVLGGELAERVANYVRSGGGIVIWAGESATSAGINGGIGRALSFSVDQPSETSGEGTITFRQVEKGHPLFSGVFEGADEWGRIASPEFTRVMPPIGGDPLIRLSNGSTLMTEYRRDRGRVVYIGVPPTTAWSSLPNEEIFVPMAIRSALFVGAGGEMLPEFEVNQTALVPLPLRGDLPDQLQVVPPEGEDFFVPVRRYAAGSSVGVERTATTGVYRVVESGREITGFAVNMRPGESDLESVDEDRLEEFLEGVMADPQALVLLGGDPDELQAAAFGSRVGLELWKYMLGLAILCAFAEMIVARGSAVYDRAG